MALSYSFNVQQGFSAAKPAGAGQLLSAAFFGAALAADLKITDPKTSASLEVAGILTKVQWAQSPAAPVSMTAYVSAPNNAVLQGLLLKAIPSSAVLLNFHVEEYDHGQQHCAVPGELHRGSGASADAGTDDSGERVAVSGSGVGRLSGQRG